MPQLNQEASAGEIRVFIPITKIDVAKRIVYGTLAAEVADKAGEIMDYETSKLAIQKWSEEQSEASGGKSLGNVREMHGAIAAGKLTDIVFVDDEKKVEGACKVVDDSTWNKIEEGVLTGFSIGGGYAKRWIDGNNPQLKRYTPKVSEFSLVDNPCQPGATFEVVKADGTVELRKFHQPDHSAQEAQSNMTTTATNADQIPKPVQGWQASDGSFHESKKDALAKNAELLVNGVTAKATEALAKLDEGMTAKEGGEAAPVAATETPAEGATNIASTEEAPGAVAEAPEAPVAAEAPAAEEVAKAAPAAELKKGLYEVSRLADLLQSLMYFQECVTSEAIREMDGSPLPAELKGIAQTLAVFLVKLVTEETNELFPSMGDTDILAAAAKAAPVGALAKFMKSADYKPAADVNQVDATIFVERLEKAMNKTSAAHLSAMADHHGTMQKCMDGMAKCMKAMGMGDDEADDDDAKKMAKAAGMTDEQLVKLAAFDGLQKKFDELVPAMAAITERLAKVEAMPAETKGVVNTALVKKNGHEGTDGTGASPAETELNKMIAGGASPEQTALAMTKLALKNPIVVS